MMAEPYSSPAMRAATGNTVRPGGIDLTRRALDFCTFARGARVLDIGCGSGVTVRLMAQEYGLDASGIDPSPTMISRGVSADPSLSLSLGDGMDLPRSDGELDGTGFRLLLWEDHLPHLKRLGAQIVLKFGSLSQFLDEASAEAGNAEPTANKTPAGGPPPALPPTGDPSSRPVSFRGISYYLAVAEKV